MKQVSLSGSPRENVGRRGAADLRISGRIPGVIYGGEKQTPFSILRNDWDKIVRQSDTLRSTSKLEAKPSTLLFRNNKFIL